MNWAVLSFGKYALAGSITGIAAIFLNLGFDTLLIRQIARDKNLSPKYTGNILIIKAALSIIIFIILIVITILANYPNDIKLAILILGISIILSAFSSIFIKTFQAYEKMEYQAIISIGSQALVVGLSLIALFKGYGLIGIVGAAALRNLCTLIASFILCRWHFISPRMEIDLSFWKTSFKSAIPLAFLPIAAIICLKTDTIMLSIMKGDAAVGWYNVANGLPIGFNEVPWIFMSALLPICLLHSSHHIVR